MRKLLFAVLLSLFWAWPLFAAVKPVYKATDVEVSPDFIIKDFSIYPYSTSYLMGYSRVKYTGREMIEYVRLDCHLFKAGQLAGTTELYGDYGTYGQNGMRPGTENFYSSFISLVDFDSIAFSISYHIGDGLKPFINKEALTVTPTATERYGAGQRISGVVKNTSSTVVPYPSVLVCIYREGQMVQYRRAFADTPAHTLLPGQSAPFHCFIDGMPYDSIVYLSNTAVAEEHRKSAPSLGMQTAGNPVLFYLSQI
jgi:hypothetical protein